MLPSRVPGRLTGYLVHGPPSPRTPPRPLISCLCAAPRAPLAPQAAVTDDLHTLFCSKLVAVVYKSAGLLAPARNASDFLPKHFAAGQEGWLSLQHDVTLSAEIPISFGDEFLRVILGASGLTTIGYVTGYLWLQATGGGHPYSAILTIQRAARRLLARKATAQRKRELLTHMPDRRPSKRAHSSGASDTHTVRETSTVFAEAATRKAPRAEGLARELLGLEGMQPPTAPRAPEDLEVDDESEDAEDSSHRFRLGF